VIVILILDLKKGLSLIEYYKFSFYIFAPFLLKEIIEKTTQILI